MVIREVAIELNGARVSLRGSDTRAEVISALEAPDDVGGFSGKRKHGAILKYDETELHFDGDRDDSRLILIFKEKERDGEIIPVLSIPLGQ